jgi:flagellar biosynthesis protein FliQ
VNEGDAVDLVQSAIWMVVLGAGPAVGAAMAVGVAIALFQALTQIQEMTLTFVPKMIAVFVAGALTISFVGGKFSIFTRIALSLCFSQMTGAHFCPRPHVFNDLSALFCPSFRHSALRRATASLDRSTPPCCDSFLAFAGISLNFLSISLSLSFISFH